MLEKSFIKEIKTLLSNARNNSYRLLNTLMVEAYWKIGKRIFEEEQKGQKRAKYGAFIIKELSVALTNDFGKGFDERELRRMRQFYQYFPNREALPPELTWSHYWPLLRVKDITAREFYIKEAASQSWGTRQLQRNINSFYYERIISSKKLSDKNESHISHPKTSDYIKDPYVFEFLGIDKPNSFSEYDLETAIINKIQVFLLELGKGFAFVSRQYCIKTNTKTFYIDLVFYNYILKAFVLIDLKITELTHQDIGQMDMYVRMFEDIKKVEGDNPTIGIILCSDKDETVVRYSLLNGSDQLFASKYKIYLPSEEELIAQIENEKSSLNQFKNNYLTKGE